MCKAFGPRRRPGVMSWRSILNPRSTRIGPTGDWYRTPNPTALRSSARSISVACVRTRCPYRGSRRRRGRRAHRHPQLGVEDHQRVAADRKPVLVDRLGRPELVEREPADRRVAAGEEALARRQVLTAPDRLPVWPAIGSLLSIVGRPRGKTGRQAEPGARREHDRGCVPGTRAEQLRGEVRLDEADLRSDRAGRQLPVGAQIVAARPDRADRRACRGSPTGRTTTAGPAETAGRSAACPSGRSARRRARCAESGSCR